MDNKQGKYFLGVDGGGTKNEAVVINDQGEIIATREGVGGEFHALDLSAYQQNLKDLIAQVLNDAAIEPPLAFAVFGLAGCDSQNDREALQEMIANNLTAYIAQQDFLVFNDTKIALRSGTETNLGLVVISGTGSNIYGRNKKGEEASAGGIGPILSDEGSGFDIGLKILQRATKSFDGRGEKSLLEDLVRNNLNVKTMREAVNKIIYQPTFDKTKIASLAPLAEEAASLGDQVAKSILFEAAHELYLGVKAVVERLGMGKEQFKVVLVGSVFKNKFVLDHFQKETSEFVPGSSFVFPRISPANAAALLAREGCARIVKDG